MKNTFQSLVRIIIIGSFRSFIVCHQQFLAIAPPFVNTPVVEPIYHPLEAPVFYPDKTVFSLPLPYQNVDFLSLPQLFFQDQNYRPPSEERSHVPAPPSKHYLVPPHQKTYQPPYSPPHKKTSILITHKKVSPLAEVKQSFPANQKHNNRLQNEKIYPTIVYKKEKNSASSHSDEISSEILEDDYSYNYGEDLMPPSQSPLLNYPYQHFRPVKPHHVNKVQSISPCSNSKISHDNLEKASPDLKAPITLLPSRFPPRIEELLERIQNYFSTYTQQGAQNPIKNVTSPSTTISVPQTTVSESPLPTASETLDTIGLSKPIENKEPNQVNSEAGTELAAVVEISDVQPVTDQEKIETISNEPSENKFEEQISSTNKADGPVKEIDNINNNNNEVYFPETTTPATHSGNKNNEQETTHSPEYFASTEAFYLSKKPTETIHVYLEASERGDKLENESSSISTLESGSKDFMNHLDSHNQNLNKIFSEEKNNENRTGLHDVMTTTNEIDHHNLTKSS